MGVVAARAREIKSGLRVDLGMESPGRLEVVVFFRVAGIWGASEISFFLFGCLSRYIWGVYISVAAVTAAWGSALTAGHFFQTPKK
jgi:hypothetical protein